MYSEGGRRRSWAERQKRDNSVLTSGKGRGKRILGMTNDDTVTGFCWTHFQRVRSDDDNHGGRRIGSKLCLDMSDF